MQNNHNSNTPGMDLVAGLHLFYFLEDCAKFMLGFYILHAFKMAGIKNSAVQLDGAAGITKMNFRDCAELDNTMLQIDSTYLLRLEQ